MKEEKESIPILDNALVEEKKPKRKSMVTRIRDMKHWDSYIKYLTDTKKDFTITESKGVKRAIWDKERNIGGILKTNSSDNFDKLWIFSSVRKSATSWLKKNEILYLPKKFASNVKNHNKIREMVAGEVFCATDLNHAYWRIALTQGIIKESLYEKLVPAEYKLYRNMALSCLRGVKTAVYYKQGVMTHKENLGNPDLGLLYEHSIRQRCFQLMDIAMDLCGDGFIAYKTDCIYYDYKYKKIIEDHFWAYRMKFDTIECVAIGKGLYIDDKEIRKF